MESQRTFLLIGLMLVSFLLFQEWNNDYNAPKADPSATTQTKAQQHQNLMTLFQHHLTVKYQLLLQQSAQLSM